MTVELFDNIINTSQDCVFWKDKDRRFLGVNQAFLDFYGFDSADVLIGKTDEDMGWHSDPEPYKQDELRVLAGESTYKVQGKCMIRGEERDIIASKRPLYENDRIVGLVGSFVDITDVLRRQNKSDGSQVMYSIDSLRSYPFFDNILDEISLDEILDPLTGILSRNYALKFVRSLIASGTPFSFTMLDLDNFKTINDTYGHSAGDAVLMNVAAGLAGYMDGFGLAGRFGGDELLLVNLRDTGLDANNSFLKTMFESRKVLRRNISFDGSSIFVTGTLGCASYPQDTDDFDELFGLIDKMLYLGKRRGRNTFTVYDKNEHKDVEIKKLTRRNMFESMRELKECSEQYRTPQEGMKAIMPLICEMLQISDLYYVTKKGRLKAVLDETFDEDASDIANTVTSELYYETVNDTLPRRSPKFHASLEKHHLGSVLVVRISFRNEIDGYLVCAVTRGHRIWQENEYALLYYLANVISGSARLTSNK
ncbi:MAG: GGDEF domain-containing protein [Lachnospiraceae bacterium]|nr:GGDEF domain-containing protein [Lachnospiraceae bacterium]